MAAIIAQLLAMFGPLLTELLKKWFESLLNKTAAANPGITTDFDLLDSALDATPRVRLARRALLRTMRDSVDGHGGPLDAATKKEIRGLAKLAD